jgi:hypothetical protein
MLREATIVGAIVLAGMAPCTAGPTKPGADFYVAVNGSDAWSGKMAVQSAKKTDGPFRTLERARDEARKRKTGKGVTVIVRGGVYTLEKTFALDAQDSGIVFQAYPGEKVILRGGLTVPPEAFKPVTDDKTLDRLPPKVRAKVLEADLGALGMTDFESFPKIFQVAPPVPELFFNDQRMTLARWPNKGWAAIAKIIAPGSVPRTGDKGSEGGVFEYSGDEPARWNVEAGVWLYGYWCFDWYAEAIQVKAIDSDRRQITLAAPTVYSVRQGNPSPRRWHALNLLEELDSPGEYYIDANAGRLYFWPPGPMKGARVVLSNLNEPLVKIADADNVVLRGFTVEAGLRDGIEASGGRNVRVQACEVRNMRQLGIRVSGGRNHKVQACDVHDTGTGGIVLKGGDRKTLTPALHEVSNSHIWRFSQHKLTYSNALMIEGVGNRAVHNLIHDAPHQAIGVVGNDHIFEYNEVHHICMETDDCGAYYKGRNPSCRGNIVRYNFFHNIGSPMGHGNAAVYFDDGDGGDTVFGNVFYRCGDPGKGSFGTVFSHGGHDITAENNIFIECKRALGSSPWTDERWKDAINGGQDCFFPRKLLEEVDVTKPPYTTRYPALIGFMDPKPGQPRVSNAVRNVLVQCGDVRRGNWQAPDETNLSFDHDPGFVDAAKGDFRLKPDSEVFGELPGFRPIPFEKMGLVRDALRPTLPKRTWP